MKKKLGTILLMLLLVNAANAKVTEVDEVVNMALENSLQVKISKDDIKGNEYKKGQTKALYMPKLKLSGGYVHFNETPDLVQLANKLGELNNGLDKGMDTFYNAYAALYATDAAAANTASGKAMLTGATADILAAAQKLAIATSDKYFQTFVQNLGAQLSQVELKDDGLNYQSVKLSLEQPLYTGGKITAVNKQVDLSIEISKLENQKTINDVSFEAKKAYYNVVLAKRSLATVNEIYKGIEKHVEEANSYFKAGLIAKLDVIRAEAKLSEIRQKVVQAENSVDVAIAYLEFVIGKDLPKDFEPNTEIEIKQLNNNVAYYQDLAYKNRVELKIYENKLGLAKENEKVMKSQNKPLIAIQGEYKYEGTDLTKEDPKWQIGLVGTWTAFDGGSTGSQIREASAVVDKASTGVELVKNSINIEVKKAYLDTINAYETIKVAEKSIEQATEVNRMATVNFSVGIGSSIEKLDSDMFLEQVRNSYDNAVNQYVISKANLEKAIGGTTVLK